MPITKLRGRQEIVSAYVDINFADTPTTATAYPAIDLPPGAQVVGGDLVVDTAWATTTTATFSVGDASSAARYLGATTIMAAGRTPLVPTGFRTTTTQPSVSVTYALTGAAATAGQARLRVDYIVNKRAAFSQG